MIRVPVSQVHVWGHCEVSLHGIKILFHGLKITTKLTLAIRGVEAM